MPLLTEEVELREPNVKEFVVASYATTRAGVTSYPTLASARAATSSWYCSWFIFEYAPEQDLLFEIHGDCFAKEHEELREAAMMDKGAAVRLRRGEDREAPTERYIVVHRPQLTGETPHLKSFATKADAERKTQDLTDDAWMLLRCHADGSLDEIQSAGKSSDRLLLRNHACEEHLVASEARLRESSFCSSNDDVQLHASGVGTYGRLGLESKDFVPTLERVTTSSFQVSQVSTLICQDITCCSPVLHLHSNRSQAAVRCALTGRCRGLSHSCAQQQWICLCVRL